jgi:single-strand DNA-binding protein
VASVNKVIIIGNLGRDPELRYTQGGQPVCQLNVATTRVYTNRNNDRVDETEWHRVTVWGKQAESCSQYLTKGRQVYVEGRLQTRSYEDKEGVKRYSTDIVAETVQFLGGRGEGGGGGGGGGGRSEGGGGRGGGGGQREGGGGGGSSRGGSDAPPEDFNDSYVPSEPGDDDIPF